MTNAELKSLAVGTRIVFPNGWEAYPDFLFTERLTGTVAEVTDDSVWVTLDVHKAELDGWDNQIQVWIWEDESDAYGEDMIAVLPADTVFTFALETDGDIVRAVVFGDVNGIVDAGTFPSDGDAVAWVNANWPNARQVTV